VVLARLVEERLKAAPDARVATVFVARDGRRLERMAEILQQLLPGHPVLMLPAWTACRTTASPRTASPSRRG